MIITAGLFTRAKYMVRLMPCIMVSDCKNYTFYLFFFVVDADVLKKIFVYKQRHTTRCLLLMFANKSLTDLPITTFRL